MLILKFLPWHYFNGNKFILKLISNLVAFSFHLFSVKFLLKTLFAPWHRVEIVKQDAGFSFQKMFDKLTFNLISRSIGFVVRSIFIIFSLVLALLFVLIGILIFILWQFIPFLSWPLFYLSQFKEKGGSQKLTGEAKEFVFKRLGIKTQEEYLNSSAEDIKAIWQWYLDYQKKNKKTGQFWEKENLFKIRSIGADLAYGFTPNLDKYCQDLSIPTPFSHQLIGREKEIKQLEAIFTRSSQNNVLLVGEPGVGKHTILQGFAKAIKENKTHPSLFHKRVLELNMTAILGQSPASGEVKDKFSLLLKEAVAAGNIILVIDQLDKYVSGANEIDLTSVLTPIFQNQKVFVVGTTTPANFEKFIFPNSQIVKFFEKIEVSSPNKKEALNILEQILPDFEKGKKVTVTYEALKAIIELSDKLISHIPFPEKAIDLLDQAVSEANSEGKQFVLKKDIDKLLSYKTKVPVGILSQNEKEKLKNLSQLLHKKIVDQEEAIEAIVKAMQRARMGISESSKPIGSFLFMGPTGVGKTETAKALAYTFFGQSRQIVRFDMSQFQDSSSVQALIGSSFTQNPGLLVKEIREKPYGVLLLDEFEKANKDILNLFLTVFDEGYLKDANGKTVSFKNLIIICTSNAAAEFIRQKATSVNRLTFVQFQQEVVNYVLKKGIFSPELVNRFDSVIVYKPLEPVHIEQIAILMVGSLVKSLEKKGINLNVDPVVYKLLANLGHSFEFGARPMKRLIADKIESLIAKAMLHEEVKKGQKIKLVVDESKRAFKIVQES